MKLRKRYRYKKTKAKRILLVRPIIQDKQYRGCSKRIVWMQSIEIQSYKIYFEGSKMDRLVHGDIDLYIGVHY